MLGEMTAPGNSVLRLYIALSFLLSLDSFNDEDVALMARQIPMDAENFSEFLQADPRLQRFNFIGYNMGYLYIRKEDQSA